MWQFKKFKTREAMIKWVNSHANMQIVEVFINNGYAVEYKPLRIM